jgi:hypothetical protein
MGPICPAHLIHRVTVILAGLTGSLPAINGPGAAVGGWCPLNKNAHHMARRILWVWHEDCWCCSPH